MAIVSRTGHELHIKLSNNQYLKSDKREVILKALSFEYTHRVNEPFELNVTVYYVGHDQLVDVNPWLSKAATFECVEPYVFREIMGGVISKIKSSYKARNKRYEYTITLIPPLGELKRTQSKKVYSNVSLPTVIRDVLSLTAFGCDYEYESADFNLFKNQQEPNYNQVLHGNNFEFFQYQLNLHAFYLHEFTQETASGTRLKILPSLWYLDEEVQAEYTYDLMQFKPSVGTVWQKEITAFKLSNKKIRGDSIPRFYNQKLGETGFSNRIAEIDLIENQVHEFTYEPDELNELELRAKAMRFAFSKVIDLTLKQIIHHPGERIHITKKRPAGYKEYSLWVYQTKTSGFFTEDLHWQLKTTLTCLEYPNAKEPKMLDYLWYPKMVKMPDQPRQLIGGFTQTKAMIKSDAQVPVDFSRTYTLFNENYSLYCRRLSDTASSQGGVQSYADNEAEALCEFVDNLPNQIIISGHLDNAMIGNTVTNKNMANTEIISKGNVGLRFTRICWSSPVSNINLYAKDEKNQQSQFILGALDEKDLSLYQDKNYRYEGIIQNSISHSFEVIAKNVYRVTGKDNEVYHCFFDQKEQLNKINHKTNTDTYEACYFHKPFNTKDAVIKPLFYWYNKLEFNFSSKDFGIEVYANWETAPDANDVVFWVNDKHHEIIANKRNFFWVAERVDQQYYKNDDIAIEAQKVALCIKERDKRQNLAFLRLSFIPVRTLKFLRFSFEPELRDQTYYGSIYFDFRVDQLIESYSASVDGQALTLESPILHLSELQGD